jgi:hypothetical protein
LDLPVGSASMGAMPEQKSPAELAMDLLFYAPVGLALSARELLPKLVEKGRQQVTGQVGMARMIGQFAVQQGSTEAEKAFGKAREQAQATLEQLGTWAERTASQPPPSSPVRPKPATATSTPSTPASAEPEPALPPQPQASVNGSAELAIPDYDSLSASQVVPRLSGLSGDELEAVRAYEERHRGRKTILNKVAQLQDQ